MTLLGMDRSEGASYLDLVQLIENVGTSDAIDDDLEELFRRVLFNLLIGNRDDHLRSHGFLREGNGWRLSPAFDVNPDPDKTAHVLAINESDTSPDTSLLMATSDYYRINALRAEEITTQVRAAVKPWQKRARAMGIRSVEIEQMQGIIDIDR